MRGTKRWWNRVLPATRAGAACWYAGVGMPMERLSKAASRVKQVPRAFLEDRALGDAGFSRPALGSWA